MEYIKLAELLYRVVKHPVQWNNQDVKRIGKIEKILQREIEAELASVGLVAVTSDAPELHEAPEQKIEAVITTKPVPGVNTPGIDVQPKSLMERVFAEQDEKLVDEIKKTEPKKQTDTAKTVVKEKTTAKSEDDGEVKRYSMNIICTGVSAKPPFQIYKGEDIVNKDFQTDRIMSTQYVFFAVVDCTKKHATEAVNKYFVDAYVSNMEEHELDWIPPQYKTIWQNKTKIE